MSARFGGLTDSKTVQIPENLTELSWADGTAADEVNEAWADSRSYDTAGVIHDLTALAADAATNTGAAAFSAVKALAIVNDDATHSVVVGNAAATPFAGPLSDPTTTWTIPPGGRLLLINPTAAGWSTAGANNLKIVAAASTATVRLGLLGLS